MEYSDQELRVIALPLAVNLVNQEIFRLLNRCNTKEIEGVVAEFVNILKYGTAASPDITVKEPMIITDKPQAAQTNDAGVKFA